MSDKKVPSVKEFVEAARAAGHDSLGIANDPEWPGNEWLKLKQYYEADLDKFTEEEKDNIIRGLLAALVKSPNPIGESMANSEYALKWVQNYSKWYYKTLEDMKSAGDAWIHIAIALEDLYHHQNMIENLKVFEDLAGECYDHDINVKIVVEKDGVVTEEHDADWIMSASNITTAKELEEDEILEGSDAESKGS
jgi:hypothetical protein